MKRHLQFRISQDRAGSKLLDFLSSRFPYHTRDEWNVRICDRLITVNGTPESADYELRSHDLIDSDVPDIPEPDVNLDVTIVYEDTDLFVVNKPANLPCHPGGRYFNHTLWAVLKQRFHIAHPIFVNRLDRETSGLTVVARNESSAKDCRRQFASHRVEKCYSALVEGVFPATLHANGFLMADSDSPVRKKRRFVQWDSPGHMPSEWIDPESAETHFRFVSKHGSISLIMATPKTGRLHQIRATLQSVGFPIVGDKLYGLDPGIFLRFCEGAMTEQDTRLLRMPRQALHASELRFQHPATGKTIHFSLPLPRDFEPFIHPSRPSDSMSPKSSG